ncbi:MAG: hypothetical protein WBX19_15120 [Terracidiphilus sp.]
MNRSFLLGYQLLIGIFDIATGALLVIAPEATLVLMGLHAPSNTLPFLSFIGAFVFSVGLACLYGAFLVACDPNPSRLETVWLLTAFARASVAIIVSEQLLVHALEPVWLAIAIFDSACVILQAIGFRKRWLSNVLDNTHRTGWRPRENRTRIS